MDSKITADIGCSHGNKWCLFFERKAMTNLDSILKNRDITLPAKFHRIKAVVFIRSHSLMRKLNHKESLAPKYWCFQIVMLEKSLESLLDSKEIKPVNPKRNQPQIVIGRTDAEVEAEALMFSPHDAKSWLTGKDPDAREDWGQEEKKAKENDMVGYHRQLNGHEFEQTPEDSERQRSLTCYSPWGSKESDMT